MAAQSSSGGSEGPRLPNLHLRHRAPDCDGSRLYGRILSQNPVKNAVVRSVLKNAWTRFSVVRMIDVDDNTMAFEFNNDGDLQQVLDLSPWSVQGCCFNLRMCGAFSTADEVCFDKLEIWIQVHGLSLSVSNAENAKQIGDSVGRCVLVELDKLAKQRPYLRMKVEISVNQPLQTGFEWTNDKGQSRWETIKYERLSDFCYGCGRLGHTSQHCHDG